MIQYRPFRNPDPPALVQLWNTGLAGRRTIPVRTATLLEYFTFAKPYFDPAGLILALDDGKPVGFVHAAFAPNADLTALWPSAGVISALAVLPSYRRRGIGTQLLAQAEAYLRARDAQQVVAGPQAPDSPFTFGLYGGCNSPGFLASDELAQPFFEKHGYALQRRCGVFQRSLTRLTVPPDPRFVVLRQHFDIIAGPFKRAGWWRECVLGPVEAVEYRLQHKSTGYCPARVVLWDMDTFCLHWGESCVGLVEMEVAPPSRRQGMAKYLLVSILRHLRERSFHLFEAQADLDNEAGLGLLQLLEFQQVDVGHSLVKPLA